MPTDYIPWTDWEDADGRVIDSDWEWLQHDDLYEGRSTFEILVGGTPYKVKLEWEFYPDLVDMDHSTGMLRSLGDSVKFTSMEVEDGDVPIYDEVDGETLSLKQAFLDLLDEVWLFDFADELFPLPYPQEPDVSDYEYEDPRMRRLHPHTPWNYSPTHGSVRRKAAEQFGHDELLNAGWKVVDCDYEEEGQLSWSKHGPDLNVSHYSGETVVEASLRGQPLTITVSWITTGFSKAMKKTFDEHVWKKSRKLSPAAKRWHQEEGEPLVEEPEGYREGLDFEIEGVKVQGAEAFEGSSVEGYGHSFDDWLHDYTYEILETVPPSEMLCGLE
jgi:hypothetical protein